MATNGQVEEVVEVREEIDLSEIEPIEPKESVRFQFTRKRDRLYFRSINWTEWWDEFNGARKPDGKRVHESVSGFILSKTKIHWQQQLLKECIGPKPKGKELKRVPWLGDWQKIRRNGFYVFDDPIKAQAVSTALREKQELIQATRALAPHIAQRLAYWYRIKDMITEDMIPRLMADDEYVYSGVGKKRTKVLVDSKHERIESFLKWQFKVEEMIARLQEQWMQVHGVDPHDVGQQWVTSAAIAVQAGAAAALTGAVAAGGHIPGRPTLMQDGLELPLPEGMSYDMLLFAQHLKESSSRFGIPLPEEEQQKSNGKAKQKAQ